MILIGSRAFTIQSPGVLKRTLKDFDFICTQDEYDIWMDKNSKKVNPSKIYSIGKKNIVEGDTNCEFEIIQPGTSSELFKDLVDADKDTKEISFGKIPNLDLLFTLKSSHKYLKNSPYFWKTLSDYHLMKVLGCKVRNEYIPFLKLREKETYTYAHPKLNQDKKSFFADDQVQYKYEHDDIHVAVKHLDKPAYRYFSKDGQEVLSDKKKFFDCSREIQLYSVVEEAAVLAVERSLVPYPGIMTLEQAWKFALSKICSSITSGWFRTFAYENALDVLKMYPIDYFDKFNLALNKGEIREFKNDY